MKDKWDFTITTPVAWVLAIGFHVYDSIVAVVDRYKLKRQRQRRSP